jgi:hypothetical protein
MLTKSVWFPVTRVQTSYRRLSDAKRSRVNASVDVSILFSALLIMLFEFSMVMLYAMAALASHG